MTDDIESVEVSGYFLSQNIYVSIAQSLAQYKKRINFKSDLLSLRLQRPRGTE